MSRRKTKPRPRADPQPPQWHVLKVHHWVYEAAWQLLHRIVHIGTAKALPLSIREPKHCPFCSHPLRSARGALRCKRCGLAVPLEVGLPTLTTVLGLGVLHLAGKIPRDKPIRR